MPGDAEKTFADLLEAARGGDPKACGRLFDLLGGEGPEAERFHQMARRILPRGDRMRDFVESRDLMQSALRSGWVAIERFQGETPGQFLAWMQQVPALGDTDPTGALQIALRLRPDVIYFLTDGSFSRDANDIVRSIRQTRTAIHTFSFAPVLSDKQLEGLELMRKKKQSAALLKLGENSYRRTREIFIAEQVLHDLANHNGGTFNVIP